MQEMVRNLANLLNDSSMTEPVNPFQKKQFQSCLRRSSIYSRSCQDNLDHENKDPNQQDNNTMHIQRVISKLHKQIHLLQQKSIEELQLLKHSTSSEQKEQIIAQYMEELETQVQSIGRRISGIKIMGKVEGIRKKKSVYEVVLQERQKRINRRKI